MFLEVPNSQAPAQTVAVASQEAVAIRAVTNSLLLSRA